jgi:hypothetical protein
MMKALPRVRQVKARALESSAILVALMVAGPAFAQCAPDPTQNDTPTSCTGTDSDGLRVITSNSAIDVASGAVVSNSGAPAIAFEIPASVTSYANATLTVGGRVDGGDQAGVQLTRQSTNSGYSSVQLTMTVRADGVVTGANGVVVGQADASYGQGTVSIDNSGTIAATGTGSAGYALLSTMPAYAGFSSITNRAGGTIGAISGPVGTLTNAGTIDGGTRSAVDWGTGYRSAVVAQSTTNSGTITSNGTGATLANLTSTLTNSGTIRNTGSGAAITGSAMTLNNATGGLIASGGATAIQTMSGLTLGNRGTITGDVVAMGSGNVIDNSVGTITGNLTLGSGNDTLVVGYADGDIRTGISGTINAGSGTNTMRIRFSTDAIVASTPTMLAGFQQMILAPDANRTATLANGFSATAPVQIVGNGTVINATTLSGAGTVLTDNSGSRTTPTIVNTGAITATAGPTGTFPTYAVQLNIAKRFENSGTIDAAGNAVLFNPSVGSFVNSGTITAGGTGVQLWGGGFANSGTIRSTNGIGAILSGSSGTNWTNSGRIEGATAGLSLSSSLSNSGTIIGSGVGVQISSYGDLTNQAGGVITGGLRGAIAPSATNSTIFNARISNAGTINGDVSFGNAPYIGSSNSNVYQALPGGVLNGNLTLGQADMFVTELTGSSVGRYAGVTGTVSSNGANLRYRVRTDASSTMLSDANFNAFGYDLIDNATLTLTGTGSGRTLLLAGQGIVDLTADLATANVAAITATTRIAQPGEDYPNNSANALTIISRGNLTLSATNSNSFPGAAVLLAGGDAFTNAGTITVLDQRSTVYGRLAGVSGGLITNSGRIGQASGSVAVNGVADFASLVNTGTIQVAGSAVLLGYGYDGRVPTVDNSGLIASTNGPAITQGYGYVATINNLNGGTITGGNGTAIRVGSTKLSNAGTIIGNVDLGYDPYNGRSSGPSSYIVAGGTLVGNLRFGNGNDVLVVTDGQTGVTGTIDAGDGNDTYRRAFTSSATVTLGEAPLATFEQEDVQAIGANTVLTLTAAGTRSTLNAVGDGQIVNMVTVDGGVTFGERPRYPYYNEPSLPLAAFTNQASVTGRVEGTATRFVNNASIGTADLSRTAVYLHAASFENTGSIQNNGLDPAVELMSDGTAITAINSGTIAGGLGASVGNSLGSNGAAPTTLEPVQIALTNSGTITSIGGATTLSLTAYDPQAAGGSLSVTNSGSVVASGGAGTGVQIGFQSTGTSLPSPSPVRTISIANSGTISANGGGVTYESYLNGPLMEPVLVPYTFWATGLSVFGSGIETATITNAASGTIAATGEKSSAIFAENVAIDLNNAGTISGSAGTTLDARDGFGQYYATSYLAGAVQATGTNDDRIVNTGTITGSIALSGGADRIENYGRIEGNVLLGVGDDSFLQRASATLIGTVDAGDGTDSLIVDATGGGTVNGDQFVNFESLTQTGDGNVTYTGNLRVDAIRVSGGALTVAAGQTITGSTTGMVAIVGSDGSDMVTNNGTITGSARLGGGNDRFVNAGLVQGSVQLGGGNDGFVEGAGSQVTGGVDGGTGTNTYTVLLSGDRSGIGQRSNFQQLAVTGSGTLSLTLDQGFNGIALAGAGLNLTQAGYRVGAVTGSDAAEQLRIAEDIASIALGGGDDVLVLDMAQALGRYDGGAGNDALRFGSAAPVTLGGTATGFESVALAGPALTVTGTLGSEGAPLSFGDGDLSLTIANGGALLGAIDLGAGNDALRLSLGSQWQGVVAGGAGVDTATLEIAGNRTLIGGTLTGFETLTTEGMGTLSLTGTQAYGQVLAATDLAVVAGGNLVTGQVVFSGADQRFTIAGGFAGAVDGGAGTDTIALSGGNASAPVAFSDVANVEALTTTGGYATVSGKAAFGNVDMAGGRLVGLAGSTMSAAQFLVRQGATFGSAGTVNGNVVVAGTLSPGASPGTMTVNGNLTLASGSTSVFELTPTISDQLIVNGMMTIGSASTLQITSTATIAPGSTYDLIIATGGISGSYTTVQKPADLLGFIVQRANRIQLFGQFVADTRFNPQVSRSIAYANSVIAGASTNSPVFAAFPALLTDTGTANSQAFAQVTPEAYASAMQIGVDNALGLVQAARGPGFATTQEEAGAFTFGQMIGQTHQLSADAGQGINAARTRGYGMLGGIGLGNRDWMVGLFGGYLDTRQTIETLGASTDADGVVAGLHGRFLRPNGFGVDGSLIYDGAQGRTTRVVPGTASALGSYDLHSTTADVSTHYAKEMKGGWTLTPRAGLTYVRTTRLGFTETGSPFALTLTRQSLTASFVDAGVSLERSGRSNAPLRPFGTLGLRYQLQGTGTRATGGYGGVAPDLLALGVARAPLVGTATAGVSYRFANGLDLYASGSALIGSGDRQGTAMAGLRLSF